jgi:hypothetical protein
VGLIELFRNAFPPKIVFHLLHLYILLVLVPLAPERGEPGEPQMAKEIFLCVVILPPGILNLDR